MQYAKRNDDASEPPTNKGLTPKQLELVAGKSREDLLLARAPNIDPESPGLKESYKKIEKIELALAAETILAQAGPSAPDDDEDFDWNSDPSVVLQAQPATAIYQNNFGHIVIRQEKRWDEEMDPLVIISAESAVTFMEALAKRARE